MEHTQEGAGRQCCCHFSAPTLVREKGKLGLRLHHYLKGMFNPLGFSPADFLGGLVPEPAAEVKVKGLADVVFLVDSTGSMKPCLDQLKVRIADLVASWTEGNMPVDWRAKIIGFRDIFVDQDWIVGLENPWVSDLAQLQQQANQLEARGGGQGKEEIPETPLDAIWKICELPDWRPQGSAHRVLVVLSDTSAKPKLHESTRGAGQPDDFIAVAQQVADQHFKLLMWVPDDASGNQVWSTLGKIPGCQFVDVAKTSGNVHDGLSKLDWETLVQLVWKTVSQPVGALGVTPGVVHTLKA